MEIIFRAIDGKEYSTQQACARHEQALMNYEMWNAFGETDNLLTAKVIHIPTNHAAERFVADCKDWDVVKDGIEGKGIYIWNRKTFEWLALDNDTVQAIQHFIG